MLRRSVLTGLRMTAALVVLLGVLYPLAVTALGQLAFPHQADGSPLRDASVQVVGSSLLGQPFLTADGEPDPGYFQPRPSAAGDGYDARASAATNLGPSNPDLHAAVADRVEAYRTFNGVATDVGVPIDAVTASGSGLDPGISVANAHLQLARVASARSLDEATVRGLVAAHTHDRPWGFLGERWVNVVTLNLALERLNPALDDLHPAPDGLDPQPGA